MQLNEKKHADSKENPIVSDSTAYGQITLQTRLAQSLFNCSWKHGKLGLVQFASIMTKISKAGREDDPYADWYLLKAYQALFDVREKIKSIELTLAQHLDNLRGVKVTLSSTGQSLHFPLQFSTPYGFMGAYLLADADYVFRQIATLKHIGIFYPEDITIRKIVHYLQDAFALSRYWRHTGITRKDVIANTEPYQKAKALMGEVPEAVLKNEIEFSLLLKKTKG